MRFIWDILNNFQSTKFTDIKDKISDYKYVSFDVFDTLIKRIVPFPRDISDVVRIMAQARGIGTFPNFRNDRIIAENSARRKKSGSIGDPEVTLEEIYNSLDGYDETIRENLMSIECEAELMCCVVNPDIKPVYDWCVENGKEILLISDMYFDGKFIEKILKKNNIGKYKGLYVSSDYGKKKKNGELFTHALEECKINPKDIIHIGDDFRSDFLFAKYVGMQSIKITRNVCRNQWVTKRIAKQNKSFEYDCLMQMINVARDNAPKDCMPEYYQYGFEVFGMILYGFARWLLSEIEKVGVKKVFFLARDGYMIKQAVDLIAGSSDIESRYLYVSRRSLRVPALWMNMDYEHLIEHFPPYYSVTMEGIMDSLGLDIQEYLEVLAEFGIEKNTIFNKQDMPVNNELRGFIQRIQSDIYKKSLEEYNLLVDYLKQEDFTGNVAVIDIGWNGNMQKYIKHIVQESKIPANIYGYYMCLESGAIENKKEHSLQMQGYIYDNTKGQASNGAEGSYVGLFETLFLANEGSTKKYCVNQDGNIGPVLYDYEYFREGALLKESYRIASLQSGALDFVKKIHSFKLFEFLTYDAKKLFFALQHIGKYPNKKALELFADFRYMDYETRYLARPRNVGKYIFRPKQLWQDFLDSTWKAGFVKRLMKTNIFYPKLLYLFVDARIAFRKTDALQGDSDDQ